VQLFGHFEDDVIMGESQWALKVSDRDRFDVIAVKPVLIGEQVDRGRESAGHVDRTPETMFIPRDMSLERVGKGNSGGCR
jgi:hypothetical protein